MNLKKNVLLSIQMKSDELKFNCCSISRRMNQVNTFNCYTIQLGWKAETFFGDFGVH